MIEADFILGDMHFINHETKTFEDWYRRAFDWYQDCKLICRYFLIMYIFTKYHYILMKGKWNITFAAFLSIYTSNWGEDFKVNSLIAKIQRLKKEAVSLYLVIKFVIQW